MAAQMTQYYDTSGTFPLARDVSVAGSGGWLLSVNPLATFGGSLVLYQDRNAPGTASMTTVGRFSNVPPLATLTAVAWTDVNGNVNAAGTPFNFAVGNTAQITAIVGLPVFALYAQLVVYAGAIVVTHFPYVAPDTRGLTANWSGITVDRIPVEYDETFELVQALEDAGQTAGTLTGTSVNAG